MYTIIKAQTFYKRDTNLKGKKKKRTRAKEIIIITIIIKKRTTTGIHTLWTLLQIMSISIKFRQRRHKLDPETQHAERRTDMRSKSGEKPADTSDKL